MLILPQLVQIWLPNHNAARQETSLSPLSEQAPRSQVPPLISFLAGLSDALALDGVKGKKLQCDHEVSLRSILACSNLTGDEAWVPGPSYLCCAQAGCKERLEFPKLPDPRVLDGVQARLDLIQWSWNEDKPTEHDRNRVSVLRDMLSRIGHLSRDPEPEMDADLSQSEPSESALTRTLVHMEIEAYSLMDESRKKKAEVPIRGSQEYCTYRAPTVPTAGHSQLRYPMPSPGQDCECDTSHEYEREAKAWGLTPAEIILDPDKPGDEKAKQLKTVRFVAPVVTEVRYFEPWWLEEYRDSGRYWSKGPHRRSIDFSTPGDDAWEIERLEHPEGLAAQISRDLEGQESAVVDDDEDDDDADDSVLDQMDKATESWDDEIMDEVERVNESWDDKIADDLKELHESWEEWF